MSMHKQQSGFTLVEAVIVIAIAGIVGSMVAVFITRPVEGYAALSRRAELVDQAEQALKRMQRDVRQALPNSLRIKNLGAGTGQVIEIIHVRAGARYRANPGGGGYSAAACRLSFTTADNSFAVMGTLSAPLAATDRIVIDNRNVLGPSNNAYAGDNITPTGNTLGFVAGPGVCTEDTITINQVTPFTFPTPSTQQRFYIVDTPITYLCDTAAGTLRRYDGYAITQDQMNIDTDAELIAASATSALVVDGITACNFTYNPGSPSRSGLVTIGVNISSDNENIALQQQFHVSNIP